MQLDQPTAHDPQQTQTSVPPFEPPTTVPLLQLRLHSATTPQPDQSASTLHMHAFAKETVTAHTIKR